MGRRLRRGGRIYHRVGGKERVVKVDMLNHAAAFEQVAKLLGQSAGLAPDALGHRLVHGGDRFSGSAIIDGAAMEGLLAVKKRSIVKLIKKT